MDKPRRPGRKAGPNAWDRYHTDMAVWKSEQQASRRALGRFATQHTPPPVDEVKAVYNPNTGVTSNYFSGYDRPEGDGNWHGHYDVDEDGNILYGRDPGERR